MGRSAYRRQFPARCGQATPQHSDALHNHSRMLIRPRVSYTCQMYRGYGRRRRRGFRIVWPQLFLLQLWLPAGLTSQYQMERWKDWLTLPPRVISTFATRRVARAEAVWKRHSSSTKAGASEGAFFRSASWEGFSNKVTIPCKTKRMSTLVNSLGRLRGNQPG